MRFLVVGAGAVGGYFGARLAEKGEDVTFLVRPARREQLKQRGLRIRSVHGDAHIQPQTIVNGEDGQFDVILLGTKAYHLEQAIQDVAPYVQAGTVVIPMLNGIKHMERLKEAFSAEQVLGGLCFIEATLSEEGDVLQTSPIHRLVFGEWSGEQTERVQAIAEAFAGANAMVEASSNIQQDMWHKYSFITALSGVTTLFRKPIGPIRELPAGAAVIQGLFAEITAIMRAADEPIAADLEEKQYKQIHTMGYEMKSSMQRDMEKGLSVEADQLQGCLLQMADRLQVHAPLLQAVYTALKLYEADLM
ncbi:2-dehydropantoate 2-reductase [Ectobacillus ponti]|uniref:2-dehydropantoate 2-reductase n=1 Tax=Ectobacillus ponti TaxID=2961894 RepID=A0AA42BP64_9BACI|nr:2-dehydropantoate 2-reductase [Ectobacillus ponti]MCP8967239.1 2-dehydropantoate 2-reductase [Ectobacillus ponti]